MGCTLPFPPLLETPPVESWHRPDKIVETISKDLETRPDQVAPLEAQLVKFAAPLETARSLLATDSTPRLAHTPLMRNIRDLGNLLIARGVLTASRGDHDEAMHDWLAAARLGLVLAHGTPHRATLLEGMVSTRLEKLAMRAIRKHLETGKLNGHQRAEIREYLVKRSRWDRSLVSYLEGERRYLMRFVDHAIEHGTLMIPKPLVGNWRRTLNRTGEAPGVLRGAAGSAGGRGVRGYAQERER